MPMKMGWRWYGEGNDPISLSDIKQIPGVTSIVWALHDKMPGEIWEIDEIQKVADQIHAYGFDMDVVESVNVHDDIKIGLPTRVPLIMGKAMKQQYEIFMVMCLLDNVSTRLL